MLDRPTFDAAGFAVVPLLSPGETRAAVDAAAVAQAADPSARAGVRDPLDRSDGLRQLAASPAVVDVARRVLVGETFVVRAILFDKTPDANWDVAWHQDVTIAVRQKQEIAGYGPWSVKQGVVHVQPPADVLERIVTVRIHLDDCGPANGPLLVVPGSHRRGVIDIKTLSPAECDSAAVACPVPAGGALVMRPLLLHASRKAISPGHRRVLHLDFASDELPAPLTWRRA